MAYDKPELEHIWAEGGAVVEPSDTKKQLGWVAEVPPHQYENWVQRRQDQFIFHVNERGIPEWDGQTNYLGGGRSLVQGSNGVVYKSVAASGPSGTAQNPITDTANTYWERAYPDNNDSRLSDTREWTAATVSQAEAEAGIATTRRAWTAQRVRQAITGWWSDIRANNLPLQSSIPQVPSASSVQEALAGLGELGTNFATVTEAQALESLTKLISAGRLGDAMNAHVLGMGQTWQEVSRVFETTYTNTTGRPIMVCASIDTEGSTAAGRYRIVGVVDGTTIAKDGQVAEATLPSAVYASVSFIVPAGSTYLLSQSSGLATNAMLSVVELR